MQTEATRAKAHAMLPEVGSLVVGLQTLYQIFMYFSAHICVQKCTYVTLRIILSLALCAVLYAIIH